MRAAPTGTLPPGGFPSLRPWMKGLLGGLFGLWLVQTVLAASLGGADLIGTFGSWLPRATLWTPWTLVTHWFVQNPRDAIGTLINLFILYSLLPTIAYALTRKQQIQALAAAMIGGTIAVALLDLALVTTAWQAPAGPVFGWARLMIGMLLIFGLTNPDGEIRLFFVIPVQGRWFIWGSLAIAGLLLLSAFAGGDNVLAAIESIGIWGGVYLWWFRWGPGGRRRQLLKQADSIQRQLSRFQVVQGGKNRDDDTVH